MKLTEYAVINYQVIGCLSQFGRKMPRIAGCWHFQSLRMDVKNGPPRADRARAKLDAPKGSHWVVAQTAKDAMFRAKQMELPL